MQKVKTIIFTLFSYCVKGATLPFVFRNSGV